MASQPVDENYYELRLYEMVQARLPRMHRLMGVDVPPIFARHKVSRPLSHWEGFYGPTSPLYGYILRWHNLDHRMKAFGSFYSDAEWLAKMKANYEGEQNVERAHICFMKASPLWQRFRDEADGDVGGIYELRRYDMKDHRDSKGSDAVAAELEDAEADGGEVLGVFDVIIGAPAPQTVAFVAWADEGKVNPPRRNSGITRQTYLFRPASYGQARQNFVSHPEIYG